MHLPKASEKHLNLFIIYLYFLFVKKKLAYINKIQNPPNRLEGFEEENYLNRKIRLFVGARISAHNASQEEFLTYYSLIIYAESDENMTNA